MTSPLPTPKQLQYQDWEFGLFLHFGIRTFYEGHVDWDEKPMPVEGFNPPSLDCESWVKTAKEAGVRYMVMTAKHHDGFANWPSQYSDYTIAATPWKDGQGDVVRDFVEACRKHDMGCGIYYSPADWHHGMKENPDAFNELFTGQVTELASGYGPLDIMWFDGCGSHGFTYDWQRTVEQIRQHQPDIMLFNMGDPDYRWVGNEAGVAPTPCWNVVNQVPIAVDTDDDEAVGEVPMWLPAECDCRMRERNWFYSDADAHTVKSVDELMGLYYYSVGRGCNLLINIGPDRRGLLPDKDAARLLEFGAEIQRRLGRPLATLEDLKEEEPGCWVYAPAERTLIDHVVIQEEISEGESISRFAIEIRPGRDWAPVYEGHSVGHKHIAQFPLIHAHHLRFRVAEAKGPVKLRGLEIHGQR